MPEISKFKFFISLAVTLLAFYFAAPNFISNPSLSFLPEEKINLGLDLKGGSQLLMSVDTKSYIEEQIGSLAEQIKKSLRSRKILFTQKIFQSHIDIYVKNTDDIEIAFEIIKKSSSDISVNKSNDNKISINYSNDALEKIKDNLISQSIEIIRMRVDETGTKEPSIQKQGDNYILLQVPGLEDPAQLKNMLGKTAKLTFHLMDDNSSGSILVKSDEENEGYISIGKKVVLTGDLLTNAIASFNETNAGVSISFNNLGAKIFADLTRANTGKRMAIVLDEKLLCAPVIQEPILSGNSFISGNFTIESANELALLLRAGALPAPLKIIEERTIGPSLGTDSIESGKKAGVIGFVMVIIFMIWTYGILGVFANIALSLSMVYIIATLSMFQATLTLPGIAGIILTIGMAVDANVLIYERIREEWKKGASINQSIRIGFEFAVATITDSNITTLIAAFLLYYFGVGTIKGFAVTLTIGILSSMFSAIIITKLLIDLWMKIFKPSELKI